MSPLLKYRKNIYSQNGEDGVTAELLRRLDMRTEWFCEFGAWDGTHLSNTFALLEKGWRGVFIEGNEERFVDLRTTCDRFPDGHIYPICAYVSHHTGEHCLDSLLAKTPIPKDFSVLSIDIDSWDYQVWQSLDSYRPKIVIIEIDSRIEPPIRKIASQDDPYSSFTATIELGVRKGYTAVCHTGNIFFVRDDQFDHLGLPEWVKANPEQLFIYNWVRLNSPLIFARKLRQKALFWINGY